MESGIQFKIISHNSSAYWKAVDLRSNILRKPLGLQFSQEELATENNQIHIAAFQNEKLIASLSLIKLSESLLKMRQVCTDNDYQGKGIGKQLTQFTERWAKKNNFIKIECNARNVAVRFYQSLGYKIIGDLFYEVGIEHYKMEKILSD